MPKIVWEEVDLEDGEKGLIVTDDANAGHTVAEGCIGEIINEAFGAIEVLVEAVQAKKSKPELRKLAEASYHLLRSELETRLDVLDGFPRKDLRPKHRDCRVILTRASKVFARNSPLLEDREFDVNQYANDAVNFIKALHLCLKEDTTKAFRESVRRGYINVATHL
jgi:hypothetical protein